MAVETDEDRAIFFDDADFGVIATVTIGSDDPFDVEGIFDARHLNRDISFSNQHNDMAKFSGNGPVFRCRTSDLAGVKVGRATITISGQSYGVHDVKHDGTGTTIIRIMEK